MSLPGYFRADGSELDEDSGTYGERYRGTGSPSRS